MVVHQRVDTKASKNVNQAVIALMVITPMVIKLAAIAVVEVTMPSDLVNHVQAVQEDK